MKTATASSTSLYCQAKCKDWKGHLTKCTVAWQCAVMVLMAQEDVRGGGCIARVFRRGEAGDEQQAQTAGGAASASTSYARVKGSVADRRISDFFGQARVEARRGAPGAKAGSLADHVHEGGLGLSSESSVLHGNPVSPEAGSIPPRGGRSFSLPGRCSPWPCSGNLLLGSTTCGRTRTGSRRCRAWAGWTQAFTGSTSCGIRP